MPPTASPIRPDGVLANHVGKPVMGADHSHQSVAQTSRIAVSVQRVVYCSLEVGGQSQTE